MRLQSKFLSTLIVLGLLAISNLSFAQSTIVRGRIIDKDTKEGLISATINFKGTSIGTNTDYDGYYELVSLNATDSIVFTYLGYETITKKVKLAKTQTINAKMVEDAITLQTAEVSLAKEKYRNKDNPAVALIKKVIAQKPNNRSKGFDYYEYEKYEKIMLGLSNVSEKFKKRKAFKSVQFLFENLDTTSIKGQEVLPIYLKESLSEILYRKSPKAEKEIIIADTMVSFEGYADDDGFNAYLDKLYQNIDIYDNNILIIDQQFLSPVAESAPSFYKFYIQDTLIVDGVECIDLFFAPRNKLDILFQGSLYIAYKDNYNIKKVNMSINSNINLNWVKDLNIKQFFEKSGDNGYVQVKDEFSADFGVTRRGMGIYGNRSVFNRDIKINNKRPNDDYKGLRVVKVPEKIENSNEFWVKNRHEELSPSESQTYQKIDSLENVKVFKRAMNIATLILSGYTPITPYFELGPVNTFYSFNSVEGFRLRAGGRTRPALSQKYEVETYGAYGFKDERWKGYLGLSHAVFGGNLQMFPVRRLRVSGQYETKIPGQALQFVQEDNILLSFKRGSNDKYLYNRNVVVEYVHEFDNNVTMKVAADNWKQEPAGSLVYKLTGTADDVFVEDLTTSQIKTQLRWAPGEQFYQGKTYRSPITNEHPVFTFRYNLGIKGLAGGEYNYHDFSFSMYKRFYLSRFGHTTMKFDAGYIAGDLPYPLMTVHTGNQTYSYQLFGFNMMNFMEFVSDKYASINLDHNLNGLVLNRVPLIKRLKLREVANLRVLYGGISDKNNPSKTDGLIAFPIDVDGNPTTFSLEEKPYVEGSLGVDNLFKFFRVDVVRRFTYLENPGIAKWGIRARFKINF